MPKTLKQLITAARQAGRNGADWKCVLAEMQPDIETLAGHDRRKRRRIESDIMGSVISGGNENLTNDWFLDDAGGTQTQQTLFTST